MAGGPWSGSQNSLLSGLWGSFQSAAINHSPSTDLWSDLRINAAKYYLGSLGEKVPTDDTYLEEIGRPILSAAGVNPGNVNIYRQVAGEWLAAKNNLATTASEQQIEGNAIFVPPWATTTDNLTPSRFRIRINATWTNQADEAINGWKTYELFGPLSSLGEALDNASSQLVGSDRYKVKGLVSVNSWELEQI